MAICAINESKGSSSQSGEIFSSAPKVPLSIYPTTPIGSTNIAYIPTPSGANPSYALKVDLISLQNIVQSMSLSGHDIVTLGFMNGLSLSGQELSLALASSTTVGALSASDWNIFNNKIDLGSISATGAILYDTLTGIISWSGSTSDILEGANLYYTQSRFDSAF